MARYNPKETEPRWRAAWDEADVFRTRGPDEADGKPKWYVLEMFPYPSGKLERRKLTQLFLRITDYADDLIEGLKSLERWPD